jgi:hypothetical protein
VTNQAPAKRRRTRIRDSQRSRVYAWEAKIEGYYGLPEWKTIEEVHAWAAPIWKAERGRYGLAKMHLPEFVSSSWGQRRALAFKGLHRISLPLWARQKTCVLHELAHLLTPGDESHGARFVGVLIGLLARHAGYRADELMKLADEMGVAYYVRSIGAVPVHSLTERLLGLLPISEMDAAFELDVSWRQVRGASIRLLQHKRARWLRGKLVPIQSMIP